MMKSCEAGGIDTYALWSLVTLSCIKISSSGCGLHFQPRLVPPGCVISLSFALSSQSCFSTSSHSLGRVGITQIPRHSPLTQRRVALTLCLLDPSQTIPKVVSLSYQPRDIWGLSRRHLIALSPKTVHCAGTRITDQIFPKSKAWQMHPPPNRAAA